MHKTVISLASVAALALMSSPAHADDTQVWGKVNVTVGLGGPWRVNNETEIRISDIRGLYEVENSLLLGYKVGKVTIASGYTHVPNYNHGNFTAMERRMRSQVTVDNFAAIGPVKFTGRLRLETRWRDNVAGSAWRLRPYIKASLPLHGKTALNLTNETFVDLGRTPFQRTDGLERSRTGIAVSTPLTKQITVEVGYLDQHGFVRHGSDTDDHAVMLNLSANF